MKCIAILISLALAGCVTPSAEQLTAAARCALVEMEAAKARAKKAQAPARKLRHPDESQEVDSHLNLRGVWL